MLTFPLLMPDELRVESVTFERSAIAEEAPSMERGGRAYAVDLGPEIWQASWQTDSLSPAEHGIVSGWLDALGTTGTFFAYDHLRPLPAAHPGGFGAMGWDGKGQIAGVTSSRVITVSGVPAGLVMTPRDYVAFDYGSGSRALHRVVAPASASGGAISLEVRPYIRTGWSAGATVYFAYPACKMFVVPGSIKPDVSPSRRVRMAFSAIQSI